jgi:hypothetical protein
VPTFWSWPALFWLVTVEKNCCCSEGARMPVLAVARSATSSCGRQKIEAFDQAELAVDEGADRMAADVHRGRRVEAGEPLRAGQGERGRFAADQAIGLAPVLGPGRQVGAGRDLEAAVEGQVHQILRIARAAAVEAGRASRAQRGVDAGPHPVVALGIAVGVGEVPGPAGDRPLGAQARADVLQVEVDPGQEAVRIEAG